MFGGDKAFWGVEPLFNVGSFFVVWRKAGERWKMRRVVHRVWRHYNSKSKYTFSKVFIHTKMSTKSGFIHSKEYI